MYIPMYLTKDVQWCKRLANDIRRTSDAWKEFTDSVNDVVQTYAATYDICSIRAYEAHVHEVGYPFFEYTVCDRRVVSLVLDVVLPNQHFEQEHRFFYMTRAQTYFVDKINLSWLIQNMFSIPIPHEPDYGMLQMGKDESGEIELVPVFNQIEKYWLKAINTKLKQINPELSATITGTWGWTRRICIRASYCKSNKGTKALTVRDLVAYGIKQEDAIAIEQKGLFRYFKNANSSIEYSVFGCSFIVTFSKMCPYIESSDTLNEILTKVYLDSTQVNVPRVAQIWEWRKE